MGSYSQKRKRALYPPFSDTVHQSLHSLLARTGNWVKDIQSEAHGTHLYRGVMTHNSYAMDGMGLRVIGPQF